MFLVSASGKEWCSTPDKPTFPVIVKCFHAKHIKNRASKPPTSHYWKSVRSNGVIKLVCSQSTITLKSTGSVPPV